MSDVVFKAGDKVRVVKKIVPAGWRNSWETSMDSAIGREFTVSYAGDTGVDLIGSMYAFPPDSLELVTEPSVVPDTQVYGWLLEEPNGDVLDDLLQATAEAALQWARPLVKQHTSCGEFTLYRTAAFKKFTKTTTIEESACEC